MVKFLLQRPIAVLMAFTACFIVGLVTYFTLPVSLLPDIAIPQITVQVSGENSSARELENTVVAPVRRQLLQVAGLREIKSETRDGAGVIRMEFEFGVNTDLAFIEVNEKIDAAMNSLPKEAERPKAIKASATDIPVLYLNMTLKNDRPYEEADEQQFLNLCETGGECSEATHRAITGSGYGRHYRCAGTHPADSARSGKAVHHRHHDF